MARKKTVAAQAPFERSEDLLKFDNQLCFRLYAASRAVTRLYRPALDALNLTYPQYLVLLAMWQWDEEGQLQGKTLKELIARLHLDSGTMTPLFPRLEDAGLVCRAASDDGRATAIDLTPKGRQLKRRATQVPEQLLCQLADNTQASALYPSLVQQLDALLDVLQAH